MTVKDVISSLQAQVNSGEISEDLVLGRHGIVYSGFPISSFGEVAYMGLSSKHPDALTVGRYIAYLQAQLASGGLAEDLVVRNVGLELTSFKIKLTKQGTFGEITYDLAAEYDLEYEERRFRAITAGRFSKEFIEEEALKIRNGERFKKDQIICG